MYSYLVAVYSAWCTAQYCAVKGDTDMSTGRRGVVQGPLGAAFLETRDFQGEVIGEHIHVKGEHVFE